MHVHAVNNGTIAPRWLGLKQAEIYSGIGLRCLQNYIAAGLIRSSNVIAPGNTRGRRLVDRESLDAFIEEGVKRAPAQIVMNSNRGAK
jgi:hypothetical protein